MSRGYELRTITGDTTGVAAIALSSDHRWLASVDREATLRVWNLDSGRLVHRLLDPWLSDAWEDLELHRPPPDDPDLLWEELLNELHRDSPEGTDLPPLRTSRHAFLRLYRRTPIAFTPDASLIASASVGQVVNFWDVSTGRRVSSAEDVPLPPTTMSFSPDGLPLVTGNWLGTVEMWDVPNGRRLKRWNGHERPITCLAFSHDGQLCATGSVDTTIKIWDVATGQERLTLGNLDRSLTYQMDGPGHWERVLALAFSIEGKLLVSLGADHRVRVWNIRTGKLHRFQQVPVGGTPSLTLFSPDGRWLADGSGDEILLIGQRVWLR